MSFLERFLGKQPAVHAWFYTKNGTTIKGELLARHGGRDGARYELAACSVAPEGSDTFKPVMGRVVIPSESVDWYSIKM